MKILRATPLMAIAAIAFTVTTFTAQAQVTNATFGLFPVGPANVTFSGLANGTEMNGATVAGVLFAYSLGNGHLVSGGGPGNTNNITTPNLVSVGNNRGVLTLTLPGFFNLFGFGYAVLNTGPLANAASVTAFSGATNLGALSYNGVPDPTFTGGFAGLQSVTAFNRLQLTFNSAQAPAFAVDNIRFSNLNVIPEPSSLLLVAVGFGGLALVGRRRQATRRRKLESGQP